MGRKEKKRTPARAKPGSAGQPVAGGEVAVKATELATQLCDSLALEMVHVEYRREPQGLVLRVYIDKPGGVTLDDCSAVSRELSDLLDVHLETDVGYNLEVSSPGVDRPLGKQDDYERFSGERVRLKTVRPVNDQKNFTGVLMGISDGMVRLKIDDRIVTIPYAEIGSGRLVNYSGDNRC